MVAVGAGQEQVEEVKRAVCISSLESMARELRGMEEVESMDLGRHFLSSLNLCSPGERMEGVRRFLEVAGVERMSFYYENGYLRDEMEVSREGIRLSTTSYDHEVETCDVLAQHEMMENAEECYEMLEEPPREVVQEIKRRSFPPYIAEVVGIGMSERKCYLNVPHYHYHASSWMSIDPAKFHDLLKTVQDYEQGLDSAFDSLVVEVERASQKYRVRPGWV